MGRRLYRSLRMTSYYRNANILERLFEYVNVLFQKMIQHPLTNHIQEFSSGFSVEKLEVGHFSDLGILVIIHFDW